MDRTTLVLAAMAAAMVPVGVYAGPEREAVPERTEAVHAYADRAAIEPVERIGAQTGTTEQIISLDGRLVRADSANDLESLRRNLEELKRQEDGLTLSSDRADAGTFGVGGMPSASAESDDLAARGADIAEELVWFSALRAVQREGAMRRGFDIGMAAAQGQTEWGPGKQRISAALAPAEQEGFQAAVSVAFDFNRYAERARVGLSIAEADPTLMQARALEADPRYGLGFDIATGIFGDPALGAQGNTATGPGSLGIRDSLSAPAQRGFNAAVQLHLGREH